MQRCPKCYRTYQNDNQKYCTACGGRLVPDEEIPTSYGLDDTAEAYVSNPQLIESAPLAGFDANQTVRVPSPPAPPKGVPPAAFDPNKTVNNAPPPPPESLATVAMSLTEITVPPLPEAEPVITPDFSAPTIGLVMPEMATITESAPEVVLEAEVLAPVIEAAPGPEAFAATIIEKLEEIPPALPEAPQTPAFVDTLYDLPEDVALGAPPEPPLPPPVFPTVGLDQASLPPLAEPTAAVDEPEIEVEPVPLPPPAPPPPVFVQEPLPEPAVKPAQAAAATGKSRLPLILGILFGLGLITVAAGVGTYLFVIKPRLEARKRLAEPTPEPTPIAEATPTPASDNPATATPTASPQSGLTMPDIDVPPPNSVAFVNNSKKMRGELAEHFVDFSFYYPKNWKLAPTDSFVFTEVSNYAADKTAQEDFAISWYESKGTYALDEASFADRAEKKSAGIASSFSTYKKLNQGPTKINGADAYQFSYEAQGTDTANRPLTYWGRVIYLPPGVEGQTNGVTMFLTATSKSPDVKGVDDVGEKGETPIILNSFRFGKKP